MTWKRGMRLTSEIFNTMESSHLESARMAVSVASAGRCGLFGAADDFSVSVNVDNGIAETVELRCVGVTASGKIVDLDIRPESATNPDTRVSIPAGHEDEAFLLTVRLMEEWREIDELRSEECYRFELVREGGSLGPDSLPVGRIVNRFGWRLDETDFVPPCLYVHSHPTLMAQAARARQMAEALAEMCLASPECVARSLTGRVWSAASRLRNALDCEIQTIAPETFLVLVRGLVGEFIIGCSADSHVSLENPEPYVDYMRGVWDAGHVSRDIERGLALCAEVRGKMEVVCTMTEEAPQAPERPVRKAQPKAAPEEPHHRRKGWEGLEI